MDIVHDKFRRVEEKTNKACNSAPQENNVNTKETLYWRKEMDTMIQIFFLQNRKYCLKMGFETLKINAYGIAVLFVV